MNNLFSELNEKVILHLDADAFFASVEISKNPKLRGMPVVTGHERGIATSMSYEAKRLGVTRGMPVFKIKKEFPTVVIVHSDYEAYALYSKRMFAIVRRHADIVEEYSIDECFADLTGLGFSNNSYRDILKKIQDEVEAELHISVSLGLGPTKVIAKLASKYAKPHGLTIITNTTKQDYLSNVAVGDVWGIGPSSAKTLYNQGLHTAQQFALVNESLIVRRAHKQILQIWSELNGRSIFHVSAEPRELPKSIMKTLSFLPHKTDPIDLFAELVRNTEDACIKVRRYGLVAYRVRWFLKTKQRRYHSYEIEFDTPTNSPIVILDKIREQFDILKLSGKVFRTTGVIISGLIEKSSMRQDLFGMFDKDCESNRLFAVVDLIAKKHGRHAVMLAAGLMAHKHDSESYSRSHKHLAFFDKLNRTKKEFCMPYLGEVT